MVNHIDIAWEKRSRIYGTQIEGVLPKSFPRAVNDYLDKWMYGQVKSKISEACFFAKNDQIKNSKSLASLKILDLGCGYGRLSEQILRDFPQVETFGIDVAPHYVSLYNKNLSPRGKAVVGDVKKLPFGDDFFDVVFMVTTLMYVVNNGDQKVVASEIFRVLKTGGSFVIIERNPVGQGIVTLGGLVSKIRGKGKKEIDAVSFSQSYLTELISGAGGSVRNMHGLPFFTLFLPFSIALNLINKFLCRKFLQFARSLDKIFNWVLTPSLYISYSGRKLTKY